MAAFKSNYLADADLNWLRGTAYPAAPANTYLALITTAPTDRAGTSLVEATGGSYARQAIPNADLNAPILSGTGVTSTQEDVSNAQISFASMPAVTVVGAAVYDALTVGNLLYYADLTGGSQVVASGATFNFPLGNLTWSE